MPTFGAIAGVLLAVVQFIVDTSSDPYMGLFLLFSFPLYGIIGIGLGFLSGMSMALITFLFFHDTHNVNRFRLGMGVSSAIGWTILPLLLISRNPTPPHF